MSREVVGRVDSYKRFIRIVVDQLPTYIKEYPSEDLLNEFRETLQHFEEADFDRKGLSNQFDKYRMKYRNTEEYLHTPFLWFTIEYIKTANQLLRVAEYSGEDFYRFLMKYLKGISGTPGVFQLIRKKTALTDLAWEDLQYLITKFTPPLTNEELLVIKTVYSFIQKDKQRKKGLRILNPDRLRRIIVNEVSPGWTHASLSRLFAHIDARWELWFNRPAFGMERFYCYFQIDAATGLVDIIDFKNPDNTILGTSDVYQVRGFQNTFLGRLVCPTQMKAQLRSYIKEKNNEGCLILHELTKITETYTSWSLVPYRAEKGWDRLSNDEMRQLIQQLNTPEGEEEGDEYYLTQKCGKLWFYQQAAEPHQAIALLCKYVKFYSFTELPWSTSHNRGSYRFTREEINLLKKLYHQKVVQVIFHVKRLINEFAHDTYWVKLSKRPIEQLSPLLSYLPICQIYYTNTHIHLWTQLTAELAHQLNTIPEWTVVPIIQNHQPQKLEFEWYDSIANVWKAPIVLQ